jgi:hypothetical protein
MAQHYIDIGRLRLNWDISLSIKATVKTKGVYDIVPHTPYHVIFLDYDRFMLQWLVDELKYFIEKYKLSEFIIMESSPLSYHAICFSQVTWKEAMTIINESNCDDLYKDAATFDFKSKVLRTFPKGDTPMPKFKMIVPSNHNQKTKSLGHINYYKFKFNIQDINETNAINNGIYQIQYTTKNHINGKAKDIQPQTTVMETIKKYIGIHALIST